MYVHKGAQLHYRKVVFYLSDHSYKKHSHSLLQFDHCSAVNVLRQNEKA